MASRNFTGKYGLILIVFDWKHLKSLSQKVHLELGSGYTDLVRFVFIFPLWKFKHKTTIRTAVWCYSRYNSWDLLDSTSYLSNFDPIKFFNSPMRCDSAVENVRYQSDRCSGENGLSKTCRKYQSDWPLRYHPTVMLTNNLIWADCNSSRPIEVHLILVPDN